MTHKYEVNIYRRDVWDYRCVYKTCHADLNLSIQWLQTYLKWIVYNFAPREPVCVHGGSTYTNLPVHEVEACVRALGGVDTEFDVHADHAFWHGTLKRVDSGPILHAAAIDVPPPPPPVLRRSEARLSIEPPRVRVCREHILNRPDDSNIILIDSACWTDAMRVIQFDAAAADCAYIPHTGDMEVVPVAEFTEYMESKSNILLCEQSFVLYCGQHRYKVCAI